MEPITRDYSIIATPQRTQQQVAAYMHSRPRANYTNEEISTIIIPAYFEQGLRVGVDPVVAIVQMIHETGYLSSWWSARPRRNPAGIGVTGQMKKSLTFTEKESEEWAYDGDLKIWKKGMSFSNWTDESIPAHIARLLGYAIKQENMTKEQKEYCTKHTAARPLPPRVQGCAPTLAGLEGTWAVPGKGYADRLAGYYNAIAKE